MATKHAWGTMNKSSGGMSDKFMKLKPDSKNKFRPVGDPVVFWRYYVPGPDGKIASAITDDPDTCPATQKHDIKARQRAAVNVIDRQDSKLKILEGPYSIFSDMKTMWEGEGESPGGQDGAEFGVKVDIPGGDRTKTKYKVMCYGASPVTAEEKKMIKESGPNGKLHNLEEEFKPVPDDEIEQKLGLVSSSKKSVSSGFDDDEPSPKSKVANKSVPVGDDEEMTF